MTTGSQVVTDDLDLLLSVMPARVRQAIDALADRDELLEVVLDLGRRAEARLGKRGEWLGERPVTRAEIDHVVDRVGSFGPDNRAGIERTLHRISAIRNRTGEVVGLTCRVGRAVFGTLDILQDVIESGSSVLLLGRPGVGKTTLLREAARVLADTLGKRVVVVDTSNEIAGDGDVPHPAIGRARRMQVPAPVEQHAVMIEAVENHMPEVIVIDEIGTQPEALAARTIAERGVQLIATAHGNTLANLLQNPTLSDLVGGIQAVTLSDEEARRRGTQKTVLERRAPPTFDVLVEIHAKEHLAVHHDVATVVDRVLRGELPRPEVRSRQDDGEVAIEAPEPLPEPERERRLPPSRGGRLRPGLERPLRLFPFAISRGKLERVVRDLAAPVRVVEHLAEADLVLTVKAQERRQPKRLRDAQDRGVRLAVLRSNTVHQIESFLRDELGIEEGVSEAQRLALAEAEAAIDDVLADGRAVELAAQEPYLRRLQHELAERAGLASRSTGREPLRRVVVQAR